MTVPPGLSRSGVQAAERVCRCTMHRGPFGALVPGACRRSRMAPEGAIGGRGQRLAKESSGAMSEPLQLKVAGPLGWLILLAAACAPIRHGHADAAHEWSRYLVGKTSEAEARPVAMRDDEEAKFLLAKIALADGRRDRAAAELRGRHPEDVELQLLEHLV